MTFAASGIRLRHLTDKPILLIVFTVVLLVFLMRFRTPFLSVSDSVSPGSGVRREWMSNFRSCVADAAAKFRDVDGNNDFMTAFRKCIETFVPISTSQMDTYANDQFGEKKFFLPLAPGHDQRDCRWLTIGVGNDTSAERLFKQKYPACSVFAAEPSQDQQGDFDKYGKIVEVGIGTEDKNVPLVIRSGNSYIYKSLDVVSLTRFLDEHVGSRLVHFLTIDIEGFEYGIVRELVGDGRFAKDGITFCQIDAEFHNPKAPNVVDEVRNLSQAEYITNFLRSPSPYIPIFNAPFLQHIHQKITFVNILNPKCEKAFRFNDYFN